MNSNSIRLSSIYLVQDFTEIRLMICMRCANKNLLIDCWLVLELLGSRWHFGTLRVEHLLVLERSEQKGKSRRECKNVFFIYKFRCQREKFRKEEAL